MTDPSRGTENCLQPAIERVGGRPRIWVPAVVLALTIGAVYYRSLSVPFIFDDIVGIQRNESIYSLWPLVGSINHRGPLNPPPYWPVSGRPLVSLSFALNYAIGGDSPASYHAINALIHFLSAMLLWSIVARTLRLPYFNGRYDRSAGWLALASALLWALHPLQTEAVVYVTQRTELMMALFYLATLYCSLRYWTAVPLPFREGPGEGSTRNFNDVDQISNSRRTSRLIWLALAFLACLCGMASKEVMVSAPLMVLLFERTFVAGSLAKALRRSWPLYVALATTWLLLLALNLTSPRGITAGFKYGPPLSTWWMTQAQMLIIYFKLVIWPWPLLVHYQLPYLETFGQAWQYAIPILLFGLATLVLLWRNKPLGYLGCCVFSILAPTSVVPVLTEMGAERRMYLPLAAFVIVFVLAGYNLVEKLYRRTERNALAPLHSAAFGAISVVAVLAMALVLGLASADRVSAYYEELPLWEDVLRYQPTNYVAHMGRSLQLGIAGRHSEAVEEIHRAAQSKPDHPVGLNNLGVALRKAGQLDDAIKALQSALKMEPEYSDALLNLAGVLDDLGRFPEAIEHLKHAVRLQPDDAVTHNNLANTLNRAGRFQEAIAEYEAAIALKDDDSHIHSNMSSTLTQMGRFQEAIEQGNEAVRLCPDCFDAHHSLGTVLLHAGRLPEAVKELHAALEVSPDDATTLNTLGAALLQTGQFQEAAEHIRHALRVRPNYEVAYNNLGQALARSGQIQEAYEQFRLATEADPHFAAAHVSWALILADRQEFKDAITHFEKAIELGSDQPDIHNSLGDAYRKSGNTDKAIEHYQIAIRQKSDYMLAHANLAQTLALVNRSKEALEAAEKAIEVARSTGQQDELGQFEEWLHHYKIELRRAAESPSASQSPSK